MAVVCRSPKKRFTKEFREAVYNINPINITCTYKEIFEVNALSKLKNLEYNINFLGGDDTDRNPNGSGGNTSTSNTWVSVLKQGQSSVKNLKMKNGYLSDSETVFKKVRGSSSVFDNPKSVKMSRRSDRHAVVPDGFHGWRVCSRPHTAACSDYRILSKSILHENNRIRSWSASAKINYSKLRRSKIMSEKRLPGRYKIKKESPLVVCSNFDCNTLIEDENLACPSGASINDSRTGSTSNLSTYSSVSTDQSVPIPFSFKHYDYPRDYIDQYRKQYTYQKLDENRPTTPPMTPPTPHSIVPSSPKVHLLMPTMPLFHWIDPITSARRVFPAHDVSETSRLFGSSPPPTRKKIAKAEFSDDELKSPHFLLAQNGVLKMEFFTNPLNCLEKTSKLKSDVLEKSPVVCRSRPTIPSNAHGNIYPSATDTRAHIVSSVKIRR